MHDTTMEADERSDAKLADLAQHREEIWKTISAPSSNPDRTMQGIRRLPLTDDARDRFIAVERQIAVVRARSAAELLVKARIVLDYVSELSSAREDDARTEQFMADALVRDLEALAGQGGALDMPPRATLDADSLFCRVADLDLPLAEIEGATTCLQKLTEGPSDVDGAAAAWVADRISSEAIRLRERFNVLLAKIDRLRAADRHMPSKPETQRPAQQPTRPRRLVLVADADARQFENRE